MDVPSFKLASFILISIRLTIAIGLLLALAGCRTPDPTVELLETELRWMEDNLYMLDDQLERCCEQLESAQRNNAALRTQLRQAQPADKSSSKPAPSDREKSQEAFDEESTEDLLRIPTVELPAPAGNPRPSENGVNDAMDNGGDQIPDVRIELRGTPDIESVPNEAPKNGTDSEDPFQDSSVEDGVNRILLNQRLTGGYDFDGEPGHEGLMVVIEPQDRFKQYLAIPGDVSVEVTDPSASGAEALIARWDYDAIESAALIKDSLLGRGVHLKLPWPAKPPAQEELLVAVVFETPDGRRLRAQKRLLVTPPSTVALAQSPDLQDTSQTIDLEWTPTR